jgi:hypothetical protein
MSSPIVSTSSTADNLAATLSVNAPENRLRSVEAVPQRYLASRANRANRDLDHGGRGRSCR